MDGALAGHSARADGYRVVALGAPADPAVSSDVCTVPTRALLLPLGEPKQPFRLLEDVQ